MAAKKKTTDVPLPPPDPAFAARQEHFAALCEAERQGRRPAEGYTDGIGTYMEKRLHAVLKEFYRPEGGMAEVRLPDELLTGSHAALTDAATRRTMDRYVADLLSADGTHIIEIQTGGFYPLIKKLHFYLCATNCRVTLVHPLSAHKQVRQLNPETGELTPPRRSPKHQGVKDIAKELYWLLPYLAEPRFTLCLPLLEVEEIRVPGSRRGTRRYDCFPLSLCDEIILRTPEDYASHFLPPPALLPEPFTAAEYAKATGLRGKAVYGMLRMLGELCFLESAPPRGRAGAWKRREG